MVERDIFTGKLLVDNKEKITFGKYQDYNVPRLGKKQGKKR